MAGTTQVIQLAPPQIVQKGAASAKIVGMMAVAIIASVAGAEFRAAGTNATETAKSDPLGYALSSPFLIFAGGTAATVVFVLLADFGGDVGEKLGTGLAGLVLLSTVLIQAGPLWKGLSSLYGATTKGKKP